MGFFKKIKKAVGKVAKLAIKTAPIWSNFVLPGSGLALGALKGAGTFGKIAGAVGKVSKFAKPALTAAKQLQSAKSVGKLGQLPMPSSWARQAVQQSPNGVMGRTGTVHARAIARMRSTRRVQPGTRAAYQRASRLQLRGYPGMAVRRMR